MTTFRYLSLLSKEGFSRAYAKSGREKMTDTQAVTCPLCRRPLDGKVTRHHLYPQKFGRKKGHKAHAKEFPVVGLHKICHRMN